MDFVALLRIYVYFRSVNHLTCSYLELAGGEETIKANAVAIFKHKKKLVKEARC